MSIDQFANKKGFDKGVAFHVVKKLAETTLRIRREGNDGRELIKEGFEGLLLLLRRLDNARTDKHSGAEPAGSVEPAGRHFLVELEGMLETPVAEKRGNAALVQGKAKDATLGP
jgi:hypothetical protein